MCQLDEAEGLDVGTQYRSDKSAAEFCHFIAEAERFRIRKYMAGVKFVSAITDGTTDSSYQRAEIVYIRACHHGKISVKWKKLL